MSDHKLPLELFPKRLLGGLEQEAAAAPIPGATWYTARAVGDGLAYTFAPGAQPLSEVVRSTTADELVSSLVITLPLLLDGLFFFRKSQVDVPPADGPRQSYSELATAS